MNVKPKMNVIFAGSPFTIVKVYEQYVDIKQNFSIGLVYKKISIQDIKILK